VLAVVGKSRSRTVAHGAALAESGVRPQEEKGGEQQVAQFHLTPNVIMRCASGKKKIVIKMRQPMTEHIVNHFMREIS
jgi:uncharacterized heparinase superfamily protein